MTSVSHSSLSPNGRVIVVLVAFAGWLCAGGHMSITQMTGQPAAIDLLHRTGQLDAQLHAEWNQKSKSLEGEHPLTDEENKSLLKWKPLIARWFTWFQCAFLFGAAAGGLVFGWLGDRIGRSKAMAMSILTYSLMAAITACSQTPIHYWIAWFLACMGVGGMWPNGVALVAEAWSKLSRPALAGVIGTAANIGILIVATIGTYHPITPSSWRSIMAIGSTPLVLAILSWWLVPESPKWIASRADESHQNQSRSSSAELFYPPLLFTTIVAILLGTVPMIGGWGTANWMNPWADESGNPLLKAQMGQYRATASIVGSLLGGWIASQLGRKWTYFGVSVLSLVFAQYIFWNLMPTDRSFLYWVAALGFVSGVYFGWLPLCLPEMFPTRVRATGAGIGFNFGRIATAVTLFVSGGLMETFQGDYARIGRWTSLLFLLGILGIWFAPNMHRDSMSEET